MVGDTATSAPFVPPTDLVPRETADGSRTLHSDALGEHYHSLFGAVAESRHVYLAQGFDAVDGPHVDLLEVGLGTGLNALLTMLRAEQSGRTVRYSALEPFPLLPAVIAALDHPAAIGVPRIAPLFDAMMRATPETDLQLTPTFGFRSTAMPVQAMEVGAAFDLVYFDAFAPNVQPEMWTVDVFRAIHRAMRPGALLVTYCAKGDVKRAMREAGLVPKLVTGPPGKYKMIQARRP